MGGLMASPRPVAKSALGTCNGFPAPVVNRAGVSGGRAHAVSGCRRCAGVMGDGCTAEWRALGGPARKGFLRGESDDSRLSGIGVTRLAVERRRLATGVLAGCVGTQPGVRAGGRTSAISA